MSEETEEVEARAVDTEDAGDHHEEVAGSREAANPGAAGDVDDAASSFLELESHFGADTPPGRLRGQAIDVERVPASTAPDDYPVDVRGEAIALSLDVDGERVDVYFGFDGDLVDESLGRLLALKGIPADRFADLYGESILLSVADGYHVPVVPAESPRGDASGVYGVAGGLAMNLLTVLPVVAGLGGVFSVPLVLAWLLANVLGVPAATYLDAWYLRTHSDWGGGPLFWTALAALPGVNVVSSLAYLRERVRATDIE